MCSRPLRGFGACDNSDVSAAQYSGAVLSPAADGHARRARQPRLRSAEGQRLSAARQERMASSVSVFGLALREVTRDQSWKREERELIKREGGRRLAVTERLMVCLSSNPQGGEELLRKTARTAAQANADWYAVRMEPPAESVQKIAPPNFGLCGTISILQLIWGPRLLGSSRLTSSRR